MCGEPFDVTDGPGLPLHGKLISSERVVRDAIYPVPVVMHVCRGDDGDVILVAGARAMKLDRDEVTWLARHLIAALDDWPQLG